MISVFSNVLVGRKMATSKNIKRTFRRYFVIITINLTKVAASGFGGSIRYPTENQILFHNVGTVVNKLTYLHFRYVINFLTLRDTLRQAIFIARRCKEGRRNEKNGV